MTWGVESHVLERFGAAGIPAERVGFVRDGFTFSFEGSPTELMAVFRDYYGPTMNAFAAAEQSGRAGELERELDELFRSQNRSADGTSITAAFLRVTVVR